MGKRRSSLPPSQMAFSFDAPSPDVLEGAMADMDRVVAAGVSEILRGDPRSRFEVAGQVSALVDADVSKLMLDAYASEARDGHNISVGRFLALVVATCRHDVLFAVLKRIGVTGLVGEEVRLAEIGHLEAMKRDIDRRLKVVKSVAEPIDRGPRK